MTKHTRQRSASNSHQYMPINIPMSDTGLYEQQATRLTVPGSFFDTNAPAAADSMIQMPPPRHQQLQPQQTSQDPYDLYTTTASTMPHQTQVLPGSTYAPSHHRASSGAWSREDDRQLLEARAKGLNWSQVKNKFSNKTANACRKRHERLMERRDADDWDNRKLEILAKEYMSMRKEIWGALAARVGEKWSVVEQKCLSNGLKNLQSASRSASRRDRLESSGCGTSLSGYDDDSGISGIGLTPVDELDPATTYSSAASPSGSHSSGGGSGSGGGGYYTTAPHPSTYAQGRSVQHHSQHQARLQQHHIQQQATLQPGGYGVPYTANSRGYNQHGYSSSVSSTASNGNVYQGGQQDGQYFRAARLSS